jgi:hypothetical protein
MICRMVKPQVDADLVRLRQFLRTLEAEAQIAVGDVNLDTSEIENLKSEIARLEGSARSSRDYGSKAFLFQMAINYGASRRQL